MALKRRPYQVPGSAAEGAAGGDPMADMMATMGGAGGGVPGGGVEGGPSMPMAGGMPIPRHLRPAPAGPISPDTAQAFTMPNQSMVGGNMGAGMGMGGQTPGASPMAMPSMGNAGNGSGVPGEEGELLPPDLLLQLLQVLGRA